MSIDTGQAARPVRHERARHSILMTCCKLLNALPPPHGQRQRPATCSIVGNQFKIAETLTTCDTVNKIIIVTYTLLLIVDYVYFLHKLWFNVAVSKIQAINYLLYLKWSKSNYDCVRLDTEVEDREPWRV